MGKWFAGWTSASLRPAQRGFDESLGFESQSIDQYGWHASKRGKEQTSQHEDIYDLFINETVVTRDHPIIAAGQGKLRTHEAVGGVETERLKLFEAGDQDNASGLLQTQAADEEGRHFSQDVLDEQMARVLDAAPLPLFLLMSTHAPLGSNRPRTGSTRDRTDPSRACVCVAQARLARAARLAPSSASTRPSGTGREAGCIRRLSVARGTGDARQPGAVL